MTGHTHTGRQKNASPAIGSGRTAYIKAGTADLPLSGSSSGEGLSRVVADSALNASIARMTGGISPVSIVEAYLDWLFHLALAPGHHAQILREGADNWWRLFDYVGQCAATGGKARSCVEPAPNDRRFKDPSWQTFPFNFVHQAFLLQQDWWHKATIGVPGVTHQNERMVEFYSRQWLDTVCPANFLATNPEIIQRTLSTGGGNLLSGGMHFFDDMRRAFSDAPPAGAEAFFPGKDVATRKGKVVFKNALMELIQYEPTTKKVHAEPILITPAWIMKYYILDLSPENSLIGYLIDNGFTVFVISWVNPEADLAGLSFDDYRQLGLGEAVDAVGTITQSPQIHIAGYCLGGTLVAIEAARMARESDARFNSISLLAAQVDFEEAGELTLFINESQITFLEDVMRQTGYLDARQMAGAFQLLRSRDLIWSRMVHHYLMGDPQGLNDLAAWNADATRMPFRMHSEYLRQLFLENELAKGRFEVDGSSVFLEDISAPTFVAATERDHVSPWLSVFKILHLLDTDVTFLLASGGHNGGIVSEPGRENRHFRVATHKVGAVHPDPETWRDLAHYQEGSWWPSWVAWLKTRSSGMHAPPAIGSPERGYPVLGDAPGEYVFQD